MQEQSYIDSYKYHGLLGDGGQASVYLCSKDKQLYAAKVYFAGGSKVQSFRREVQFLKKLHFANLINIVGDKEEAKVKLPGKEEFTRPVLFLEFAEGGELFEYIAKEGRFPTEICRTLTKMLISAIQYLNSVGVTHRDLKPQNILFDKNYILKVSDFGLSTLSQGHDGDGILYTKLGTEGYKPPEMELGKYTGIQADLFAAGVILFVMYVGTPPFISTKNTDKIYRLIRERNFAKFWSLHEKKKPQGFFKDSFKRLINSFFSAEVQNRPTLESLKEDEWLNEDQAMQNDVFTEMNARYQRMLANDVNKQKIQKAKLEMYKSEMEEQCCEEKKEPEQSQMNEETEKSQTRKKVENKDRIIFPKVKTQDLRISNKCQLPSTKLHPSLLLAWIQSFLQTSKSNNNIFLQDPILPTKPETYFFKYNPQTNKILIDLTFKIVDDLNINVNENEDSEQSEDNETIQSISIEGQLIKFDDGKIGIQWGNKKGNSFWLACFVGQLESEIKVLG